MSYCVHCGVRLEASARKCPLCGTHVIHPSQPPDPDAAAYPVESDAEVGPGRFTRKNLALIISACLALPALLSAVVDAVYGDSVMWSLYVIGAVIMIWVMAVLPLFTSDPARKSSGVLHLLVPDAVAILAFLWLVERLTDPDAWFMDIGLPVAGAACFLIIVNVHLVFQRILRGLYALASFLIATALLAVVIELAITGHFGDPLAITWSLLVAAPCVLVAVILMLLGRNRRLREDMVRRLHF